MLTLIALGLALAAECGPMALKADNCTREARVWTGVLEAWASYEWMVVPVPEAA